MMNTDEIVWRNQEDKKWKSRGEIWVKSLPIQTMSGLDIVAIGLPEKVNIQRPLLTFGPIITLVRSRI